MRWMFCSLEIFHYICSVKGMVCANTVFAPWKGDVNDNKIII